MQGIMKPKTVFSDIERHLERLAAMEAGDAAFISCYLDLRSGSREASAFLAKKAAAIRRTLHGTARFEFERALAMIERQLAWPGDPDIRGLALFARGDSDIRCLEVVPLAVPVENRVVLYRMPEILPLLALRQNEAPFTLLLGRRSGLQLLDVDMGRAVPRAWSSWGMDTVAGKGAIECAVPGGTSIRTVARLNRPLTMIRRALSASSGPLVVAGDVEILRDVAGWLPQRSAARLLGSIEVSGRLGQRDAIDFVRARLGEARRYEAQQTAARLVRLIRATGPAVGGERAAWEALQSGSVETLVIATSDGAVSGVTWDPPIELARLACRQGAQVVLADSDELRYLGGVGCLLRQPANALAMPARPRPRRLDLVA